MFKRTAVAACVAIVSCASAVRAGAIDELWVHSYRSYFASEKQFRAMMDLVPRAKAAGYTGVCFMSGRDTDGNWGQIVSNHDRTDAFVARNVGLDAWWRVAPERQRRFKEFKAQCDRYGLDFVPFVWSLGYGGAPSLDDPTLGSVWPVRDVPYVVRGGRAVYAGGEEVKGDIAGLMRRNAEKKIFGGAAKLSVRPARRYRVSCEVMTENLDKAPGALPRGIMFSVRTADGALIIGSKRPHLGANRKWSPIEFTFNSFDETNVLLRVACGAHGGGMQTKNFDEAKAVAAGARFGVRNIRVEELGLEQPIRRAGAPFVVREATSGRKLREGAAYEPPPVPRHTTFSGPYEPVDFAVSERLPEGTRLIVSSYEPTYYWGMQNGLCLTNPGLYEWFDRSAAALVREFGLKKWLFSNDEIRNECRCELCVATKQNVGQRFAAAVTRAREIVRRHAPDADIYMFADQVDPNHNAEEHCCGCHTSFIGVWDLMPKDVIMCPWYGSKCDVCVKFLDDHGYRTFGFGYYDAATDEKTVEGARNWTKALVGAKGGRGLCYTSWLRGDVGGDFSRLELFAKAAREASCETAAETAALRSVADKICRVDEVGGMPNGGIFVEYSLRPEPDSEIRCRLELPAADKWTGELLGVGSSSQGGYISKLTEFSDAGLAAVMTDLGTTEYEKGARKGKPWPEAVFKDYSWRATHLMTVSAKRFVRARYGKDAKHSYFRGGSCGGRQALSEAMRFPEDYDGIISVIPAAMAIAANAQILNVYHRTHDETGKELFTTNQLRVLAEAPIEYMKDRDVKPYAGSILSNPFFSEEDIDGLVKFVATKDPTLADPDLQERMKGIFLGAKDSQGRILCHGMLPGTRHGNPVGISFRSKGLCMSSVLRDGARYSKYPSWDEFEKKAVTRGGEINASSFDLSAFAKRGGKLIVTCGWEDQTTPAPETVAWYEYLAEANGGFPETQRFCRLFPLPGVAHGGGRGRITTGGGAVGKVHLDALRQWVEKDVAPETYPLSWPAKKLTLPIPPYPLQCYLGDDGKWKTRRYPEKMVRRPDRRYYKTSPL